MVKLPNHYDIDGKIEAREAIEWAVADPVSYHHASVLKYLLRANKKEDFWKDIQKAHDHFTFLLGFKPND